MSSKKSLRHLPVLTAAMIAFATLASGAQGQGGQAKSKTLGNGLSTTGTTVSASGGPIDSSPMCSQGQQAETRTERAARHLLIVASFYQGEPVRPLIKDFSRAVKNLNAQAHLDELSVKDREPYDKFVSAVTEFERSAAEDGYERSYDEKVRAIRTKFPDIDHEDQEYFLQQAQEDLSQARVDLDSFRFALDTISSDHASVFLPSVSYNNFKDNFDIGLQGIAGNVSGFATGLRVGLFQSHSHVNKTVGTVNDQKVNVRRAIEKASETKSSLQGQTISLTDFIEVANQIIAEQNQLEYFEQAYVTHSLKLQTAAVAGYQTLDGIGSNENIGFSVSYLQPFTRLHRSAGVLFLASVQGVFASFKHQESQSAVRLNSVIAWQNEAPYVEDPHGKHILHNWSWQIGAEYDARNVVDDYEAVGLFVRYRDKRDVEYYIQSDIGLRSTGFLSAGIRFNISP